MVWLRNPYVQMNIGVRLLSVSALLWAASQLTNKTEPPQILALSWLAVVFTALTLVLLTDVGEKDNNEEEQ